MMPGTAPSQRDRPDLVIIHIVKYAIHNNYHKKELTVVEVPIQGSMYLFYPQRGNSEHSQQ